MKTKVFLVRLSLGVSVFLLSFIFAYTQAPYRFNYRAVARDDIGQILKNEDLTIKIGIISESISGELQWEETHPVTTNDFGIFRFYTNIDRGN